MRIVDKKEAAASPAKNEAKEPLPKSKDGPKGSEPKLVS
jgi:hypothetical protein